MLSNNSPNQFLLGLAWLGKSLTILLLLIFATFTITALYIKFSLNDKIPHFLWIALTITGLLLAFVVTIQLYYWFSQPIILPPPETPEKRPSPPVGLIFIQGEGIPVQTYTDISKSIQASASDLDIWVGIPKFIGESPIPREMGLAVDNTIRKMKQQGMPEAASLFFIAHSVGGIALAKYLNTFHELINAKGQVLMGSFLGKWYFKKLDAEGKTIVDYPVPTLTIGGTLDGLARVTRIAAAYWYQQINAKYIDGTNTKFPATDRYKFPVVVVEGASHMQFAKVPDTPQEFSKQAPFVAEFDLIPTATQEDVHTQVGEFIHHFMGTLLSPNKEGISHEQQTYWNKHLTNAESILQPIINAFENQEGYYGFKPPFYGTYLINSAPDIPPQYVHYDKDKNPKCFYLGSPWIQYINTFMAAPKKCEETYSKTFTLPPESITDNFHRSSTILPYVHLPTINWNKLEGKKSKETACSSNESCEFYKVTSVTQALYNWFEAFDTGFFPISAFSLRAKLNSRQKFWQFSGISDPDFQITDGASLGSEINQQAYQWALANAGESIRKYFHEFGVPMAMGKDVIPLIQGGPFWLLNYPKYKFLFLNGKYNYVVQSVALKIDINYWIPLARGFHYNQLLSPAAATEWIYVDGLRLNRSVSGNTFVYGPLGGIDKVLRFILRGVLRQLRIKGVGLLKRI